MKGLHSKYIVTHADGSPINCRCFVLMPETDHVAREAISTYADKTQNTKLAKDLTDWLLDIEDRVRDKYWDGDSSGYPGPRF